MKGYREFAPGWEAPSDLRVDLKPTSSEIEWQETSLLEGDGFRPY